MNNINRTELKILAEALDLLRSKMREEIVAVEITEDGFTYNDQGVDEYNRLVRLQDRIIDALEARFY